MANDTYIKKFVSIAPWIEIFIRRLYWKNQRKIDYLLKIKKTKYQKKINKNKSSGFKDIADFLREQGVRNGSLLLAHTSYDALKITGKSPHEIIDEILSLIGESGTLAVPAMPMFKNDLRKDEYLNKDISDLTFDYNVNKTPIKTGLLPRVLYKMPGSIRSRHPINTMVAKGSLAGAMMEKNLENRDSLPCGKSSSWDFCARNGAIIIGLGVDLTHSLTMIHVSEDCKGKDWPVKGWYRKRRFRIKDGSFNIELELKERAPKWGALHFAERTLCKDLIKDGLLRTAKIGGVTVEVIEAGELVKYLNKKNGKGYPYFGITKYLC